MKWLDTYESGKAFKCSISEEQRPGGQTAMKMMIGM